MRELVDKLNAASEAYYNSGTSIMTDTEFDSLMNKLKKMEEESGEVYEDSPTRNVGSKVLTELKKIKHNHPMLSLDKCHTNDELRKFTGEQKGVAMVKLDGLTISIKYIDGILDSAETRGDGIIGSDVSEHIKYFLNVPKKIDKPGTYIIDGEAIIKQHDFDAINTDKTFANPRNLASGTLSMLDVSYTNKRRISFVAWDVIEGNESGTIIGGLAEAQKLGFEITPTFICDKNSNFTEINDKVYSIAKSKGYPLDGVVYKYDDVAYGKSLGRTETFFRNGIAWKPANITVDSKLLNIEWSMGKTGQITPVAIYEPVRVEGTVIERASLHNLTVMRNLLGLAPYKGQPLKVCKANSIIPMIASAERRDTPLEHSISFNIPVVCPCCGGDVIIQKDTDSEVLVCANPDCSGKLLGKLKHFVSKKAMNIEDMSESTLKFLIAKGWVNDFIDLYDLDKYYDEWIKTSGFGKKSVDGLLKNIKKSTEVELSNFLCSLSIPQIGGKASKDISKFCNGNYETFVENWNNTKCECFTAIDGFGDVMLSELKSWLNKNFEKMNELASIMNFKQSGATGDKLAGLTFVITGKLTSYKNRDALVDEITSLGGKVAGAVSKSTSYLINNDTESTTGKNKKAKDLGIPIISEEEYKKLR